MVKDIKNIRLTEYDYSKNGYYFITICTNYSKPYLVESIKSVVSQFIEQIPCTIPGTRIDYYELVATHLHLILVLDNCKIKLGEIIRRFKAKTTLVVARFIGQDGFKLWQPNYYEHIIRNEPALDKIREYIQNNPIKKNINWEEVYRAVC